MMKLLILSVALVMSCTAAPQQLGQVVIARSGVQPTLLTADQLNQLLRQPAAIISQPSARIQQAPAAVISTSSAAGASIPRDPSNPTTDVLIHSGFPFGSASLSPQLLSNSVNGGLHTTRVGISSVGNVAGHVAHVATVQPTTQAPVTVPPPPAIVHTSFNPHIHQIPIVRPVQPVQPVAQPSSAGVNLPPGTTFLIPASAAHGQTHQQLTAAGFRTIPITLSGPIPSSR